MRLIFFLVGIILLGFALFANALGIDNDPGWGPGRVFLLLTGLLFSLPTVAVHLFKTGRIGGRAGRAATAAAALARNLLGRAAGWYPLSVALTVLVWATLAAYGAWLTSAGRFPSYPPGGGFYPLQAEAFLHGQLSLLEQPDPILLALPDPYDMLARDESGAKVVWDASLYNGKYYTYWGPVPAVILAAAQAISRQAPSNPALGFCLYAGLAGALAGVLHLIRRRFYPRAPGASIPIFLLAAALSLHTQWLVGRFSTYETSIISGQFFLFLGLLFWMIFLERERAGWLVLAGLSWGLTAGSRNTMVVSVVVYAAFAALHLWRTSGWKLSRLPWGKVAALAAPLALCALALASYNYVRFGSPTETGVTYQLSLAVHPRHHFSAAYIPTNLYMWLFYRFELAETFPFFPYVITYPANLHFPAWAVRPEFKMFDREFYGLLPSAPVTWLLALGLPLLVGALWRRRKASSPGPTTAVTSPAARLELAGMIGLAGFLQFALLLFFFYAATRYGADFILPAVLVAAIFAWEADAKLARRPRLRAALWTTVTILCLSTAVIGVFGSFYVPEGFLRTRNPQLFAAVAAQWNQVGGYVAGFLRLIGRVFYH